VADNEEPIIIRDENMPGVNKTLFDFVMLSTIPVAVTKVTRVLDKRGQYVTIGLKENLNVGNIIQHVYTGLTYKIMKLVRISNQGRIYKIKRTDGSNITGFDTTNISLGDRIIIKSRTQKRDSLKMIERT
jgi:hypothetical protein